MKYCERLKRVGYTRASLGFQKIILNKTPKKNKIDKLLNHFILIIIKYDFSFYLKIKLNKTI